ncbi:MAG: hypothetical protein ACYTEX_26055 [Planctomycetota bacterium]|jgi:hypothetical protein
MTNQNEAPKSIAEAVGQRIEDMDPKEFREQVEKEPTEEVIEEGLGELTGQPEPLVAPELPTEIAETGAIPPSGPTTTTAAGPPAIAPLTNDVRAGMEAQFQAEREAEEVAAGMTEEPSRPNLRAVSARIKQAASAEANLTTTPASNTSPQPATKPSSPELSESPPQGTSDLVEDEDDTRVDEAFDDTGLHNLSRFVNGPEFTIDWCRMHLLEISRIPNVVPSPTMWDLPAQIDVAKVVFDVVRSKGFVENSWPSLQVVMGSSVDNVLWCCGVLCTMAIFRAIQLLPLTARFGELDGD